MIWTVLEWASLLFMVFSGLLNLVSMVTQKTTQDRATSFVAVFISVPIIMTLSHVLLSN